MQKLIILVAGNRKKNRLGHASSGIWETAPMKNGSLRRPTPPSPFSAKTIRPFIDFHPSTTTKVGQCRGADEPRVTGLALQLSLAGFAVLTFLFQARAGVVIYPAPEGAPLVAQYHLTVADQTVPVYLGSPKRFYGFCQFDIDEPVTVRVNTTFPLDNPRIIPDHLGIKPSVEGRTASFTLQAPCKVTFLPNGETPENALHIFANPLQRSPPREGDPGVIFIGPGIHRRDITVGDGQTLYLAGGAILKGAVTVAGHKARVQGRGIIDGSEWGHFERRDVPLRITGASTTVEGIIVRLSWRAGISVVRTTGVQVVNAKICASRFANDDGITVSNASEVTVRDCFIRTDDDCIALKGYSADRRNVSDCIFENTQLWCDRARIILIGHETMVHHMRDIVFKDIDILRYSITPFLIEPGELGTAGPGILFEEIRILGWGDNTGPLIQIQPTVNRWMQLKEPGWVDGISFRNIRFTGRHRGPWVRIQGYDANHTAKNIRLEGVFINGQPLTPEWPGVLLGPHAENINFLPGD